MAGAVGSAAGAGAGVGSRSVFASCAGRTFVSTGFAVDSLMFVLSVLGIAGAEVPPVKLLTIPTVAKKAITPAMAFLPLVILPH